MNLESSRSWTLEDDELVGDGLGALSHGGFCHLLMDLDMTRGNSREE